MSVYQLQDRTINAFDLCKDICKLNENILGAAILDKGSMIGMYSKPYLPVPVPNEERFRTIFFQTHFIELIHRSNEDFYGDLKFFTAHFSHGDVYSFPLDKFGYDKNYVLAFKIIRPYSSDAIVNQITEYLQSTFKH